MSVHVGTSSWADPGFVEEWYPRGLAARDRLAWYAERFDAVELNSSFYAVPARDTVARWVEVTPPGFTFDVKLHRLLSRHAAPVESLPPDLRPRAVGGPRGTAARDAGLERALLDAVVDATAPLAAHGRLASFLLQMTPAFKPGAHDLDELRPIVEHLAPHPVAIELRHRGWVETPEAVERTLAWYEDAGAAWVGVDMAQGSESPTVMPPVDAVTRDDLAYLRAHGRNLHGYLTGKTVAERFGHVYTGEELRELHGRVVDLGTRATDVRVMFNNNRGADAPNSAREMRELLGQDAGPPTPPPDRAPPPSTGQASLF